MGGRAGARDGRPSEPSPQDVLGTRCPLLTRDPSRGSHGATTRSPGPWVLVALYLALWADPSW